MCNQLGWVSQRNTTTLFLFSHELSHDFLEAEYATFIF